MELQAAVKNGVNIILVTKVGHRDEEGQQEGGEGGAQKAGDHMPLLSAHMSGIVPPLMQEGARWRDDEGKLTQLFPPQHLVDRLPESVQPAHLLGGRAS